MWFIERVNNSIKIHGVFFKSSLILLKQGLFWSCKKKQTESALYMDEKRIRTQTENVFHEFVDLGLNEGGKWKEEKKWMVKGAIDTEYMW